jgi:hypothetical protein
VQNLVTAWDTGDGSSAVLVGANGAPNGYINGYEGRAGTDLVSLEVYPDAATDYFTNKSRDEFNLLGQPVAEMLDNEFPLSFSIPAAAGSVQLKIYGAGFAGSETVTVSDVLFSTGTGSGDSDGDGVSDANEVIMGTDPNIATDVLRLSVNAATPTQIQFPSKNSKYYRVYSSTDLITWTGSGTTIPGDGSVKLFDIITTGGTHRFYRLHVMDTDGPWVP